MTSARQGLGWPGSRCCMWPDTYPPDNWALNNFLAPLELFAENMAQFWHNMEYRAAFVATLKLEPFQKGTESPCDDLPCTFCALPPSSRCEPLFRHPRERGGMPSSEGGRCHLGDAPRHSPQAGRDLREKGCEKAGFAEEPSEANPTKVEQVNPLSTCVGDRLDLLGGTFMPA